MNIALCGFMGSGKSTVSVKLANRLGYSYVDIDNLVSDKCSDSIANLFAKFGEGTFRQLETEMIEELAARTDTIIALGGGSVINEYNVDVLKGKVNATIVYLKVPFEICYDRVKNSCNRPLIISKSKQEIEKLYCERDIIYSAVGDIIIECEDSSECVENIIRTLSERGEL